MGGVEHKIRDILNKMMLETTMTEEIKTKVLLKVLDSELQYIQLNPQNFEEVINKVTNKDLQSIQVGHGRRDHRGSGV